MDQFDFHKPSAEQILRIEHVRAAARNFWHVIEAYCPPSADRSAAQRKVREAMMTANASIAQE